jgi:hypothetical protein
VEARVKAVGAEVELAVVEAGAAVLPSAATIRIETPGV